MNKRLFIFVTFAVSILGVFALTMSATALSKITTIHDGNYYKSEEAIEVDSVSGDALLAGETIIVNGNIKDNLIAAGNTMKMEGSVDQNLVFAGAGLEVNGSVYNDIYAAGAYVVVNGDVFGDVRIFANEVYINSKFVGGDLIIGANKAYINDELTVKGRRAVDVATNLTTSNVTDLSAFDRSNIKMFIDHSNDGKISNKSIETFTKAFSITGLVIYFIMLIGNFISYYFILRFFPIFTEKTLKTMKLHQLNAIGIGMVSFIIGPVIAVILLFSGIGIPLLVTLIMFFVLATYLSKVYSTYLIGRLLLRKYNKHNTGRFIPLLLGFTLVTLALLAFGLIPVFGGLFTGVIELFLMTWGLGAIILNKFPKLFKNFMKNSK